MVEYELLRTVSRECLHLSGAVIWRICKYKVSGAHVRKCIRKVASFQGCVLKVPGCCKNRVLLNDISVSCAGVRYVVLAMPIDTVQSTVACSIQIYEACSCFRAGSRRRLGSDAVIVSLVVRQPSERGYNELGVVAHLNICSNQRCVEVPEPCARPRVGEEECA